MTDTCFLFFLCYRFHGKKMLLKIKLHLPCTVPSWDCGKTAIRQDSGQASKGTFCSDEVSRGRDVHWWLMWWRGSGSIPRAPPTRVEHWVGAHSFSHIYVLMCYIHAREREGQVSKLSSAHTPSIKKTSHPMNFIEKITRKMVSINPIYY